eukprot:scaffold37606_cov27-Tisochrysis_lutea.AAC.3
MASASSHSSSASALTPEALAIGLSGCRTEEAVLLTQRIQLEKTRASIALGEQTTSSKLRCISAMGAQSLTLIPSS